METAEVAETPLYLQITRQLHQAGLIQYISASQDGEQRETYNADRAELRLRLLQTWMEALLNGHFASDVALSRDEREVTVEQLSALACIGLRQDSLYVRFDDLQGDLQGLPRGLIRYAATDAEPEPEYPPLIDALRAKLEQHRRPRRVDIRLAATFGMRLGLVEARGEGVRFPHSIMQAYLGSRLIDHAMADPTYRQGALEDPGRELLIALVLHSRAKARAARPRPSTRVLIETGDDGTGRQPLRDLLVEAAADRDDVKALDLYAAALEIDSVEDAPAHADIATRLAAQWPRFWARDQRTLEDAKLNLVGRLGEAARAVAERARRQPSAAGGPADAPVPAYPQLYRISCVERSYPVRLAAAQEIGAGGDEAFAALKDRLGPELARKPPGHTLRDGEERERSWRENITRAWLAPILVGSVSLRPENAQTNLERWLEFVVAQNDASSSHDLGLSVEIALAQGFKYVANRRRRHPLARPEARAYLSEQARKMLKDGRFWFSRLTLVQALCLWSLPDNASDERGSRGDVDDPSVLLRDWLTRPNGESEHPFVLEAGRLGVSALKTGQPERFLWIDEARVLARIGSRPVSRGPQRQLHLWIPPPTGWTALHPRAQQLIADVLVLLNLAERGASFSDCDRRLERTNRIELPPCLAGDRSSLDPTRTVSTVVISDPGSNCKVGCLFQLCPYPHRGEMLYRGDLSEAFCRRQQTLANASVVRSRAPWQGAPARDIERFWKQMGRRAQPSIAGSEDS